MACHNSKCLLWVPNNVPLIVICVCEDELYTLYENLHYHLDEFVTLIWYMAVTLILSYVLIIETDFDSHTLRASYLSERLQPPGFESEICFGLWHSSLPFYCLSTVNVSWAGLWEAVHNGPRHPKCLYYPKGSYYQGLNLEYMTSCDIEVNHLVHINNEKNIPYILQTLKCYWAWTQIICWDEKMNMLINFYSSGHQFTKKIITR